MKLFFFIYGYVICKIYYYVKLGTYITHMQNRNAYINIIIIITIHDDIQPSTPTFGLITKRVMVIA